MYDLYILFLYRYTLSCIPRLGFLPKFPISSKHHQFRNQFNFISSFASIRSFSSVGPGTMKVHPVPKKRNITLRYDVASSLSTVLACRQKKLRRLPHIFAKVLELPFHSDADVSVDESSDCLQFSATTDGLGDDVRAHTIEIYPGVSKIVIRGSNVIDLSMDGLELDLWRFRLPAATRPELATAAYRDGELVVTVPKDVQLVESEEDDGNLEEDWEEPEGDIGTGRLVLVQ